MSNIQLIVALLAICACTKTGKVTTTSTAADTAAQDEQVIESRQEEIQSETISQGSGTSGSSSTGSGATSATTGSGSGGASSTGTGGSATSGSTGDGGSGSTGGSGSGTTGGDGFVPTALALDSADDPSSFFPLLSQMSWSSGLGLRSDPIPQAERELHLVDDAVLATDLVAYWKFNGTIAQDVSTAANAILDYSGNDIHGTLMERGAENVSFESGILGTSLRMRDTDGGGPDYIDLPDHPSLDLTGALSISFWLKDPAATPDPTTGVGTRIFGKWNYPDDKGYLIDKGFGPDLAKIRFRISGDCNNSVDAEYTPANDNLWHHIVAVYSPSNYLRIYRDGLLVAENTTGIPASICQHPSEAAIGSYVNPDVMDFNIDELMLFGRVLTAQDALDLYSKQSSAIVKDQVELTSGIIDSGVTNNSWNSLLVNLERPLAKAVPNIPNGTVDYSALNETGFASGFLPTGFFADLQALWHFDGPVASDLSLTAASILDYSGRENHLTAVDPDGTRTLKYVDGRLATAAQLDGVNDRLDLAQSNAAFAFNPINQYTWATWIKLDDFHEWNNLYSLTPGGTTYVVIYAHDSVTTGANQALEFQYLMNNPAVHGGNAQWVSQRTWDYSLIADKWLHVAVVFDGSQACGDKLKIYVDGIDRTDPNPDCDGFLAADPDEIISGTIVHLAGNAEWSEAFAGSLDEFMYFTRALDQTEVNLLYERGRDVKLRFQVQTCSAADCSGAGAYVGPGADAGAWFSTDLAYSFAGYEFDLTGLPSGRYLRYQMEVDQGEPESYPVIQAIELVP